VAFTGRRIPELGVCRYQGEASEAAGTIALESDKIAA
jgi:hypothetical protein